MIPLNVDDHRTQEEFIQLTSEFCDISGVSGYEHKVVACLAERFRPYADSVEVDSMGNLYAYRNAGPAAPTVLISAHSDEIGGVVRAIEPNGFLRLNKLGGVLDSLLVGRMVMVGDHFGVIGVKAGHSQTEEERSRVLDYTRLHVDVGADSEAEVAQMAIQVGSPVTYVSRIERFSNPSRVCGKGLDNRLGCAILCWLLKDLQGEPLPVNVCVAVAAQEEVGLRGAQVLAYHVNPKCAVVVDTIPCGDTPDDPQRTLPIGIGKGPAFRLVSRGDVMHHGMKRLLIETAEAEGIPYQLVVHDRSTTDASEIHKQREGIPTAVVTIPRRNAHSPVEVADVRDSLNTLRLLEALVGRTGRLSEYLAF